MAETVPIEITTRYATSVDLREHEQGEEAGR